MRRTSKTDYIKVSEQRRRRASVQDDILKGPRPETWSAQMPAYCYTVLCSVVELRDKPDVKKHPERQAHPEGIRPMKAEKLCMCCRKRWSLDCGRERCDCKEQGYLYVVGIYMHPVMGGDTVGQGDS
ncbi:hypothetical protein CLOSYM_00891 [[Clostridium] symbiosum ATCC 14940]|uniref:Cysteine-rich VLP domain-containing protein n=1 Tax=[Clostridium] symbiosum ATCC 14940 TaxID=411472 RepID=A0ABC9U297_CLOSY|nr:hypothetical protein CLOSYM_00891 [[Clostridium] symbiosum ATCC 14940]DAJ98923.1 MAG TPA: hypothetical protein [Caudoviricetes sp.]